MVSFFKFLRYQTVGKGYTEQTKIAVRRSRTTALLRALVHVIPVSVALWEIELNWNTYFVGYDIYDQAYYQFGAKVHEIAIEASLSAIIFSYIRYELMLGDGIPFGALFSGLQVSQASYLWSMEFWGTVCSNPNSVLLKSKLRLIIIIAVSVFLAAVAGPSSAVLLIPKLDYWPAGSTHIWLNVSSETLWPTRSVIIPNFNTSFILIISSTNASDVSIQCLNANVSDSYLFSCPSHGWEAILNMFNTDDNLEYSAYLYPVGFVNEPGWVEVIGHGSLRRLLSGEAGFVPSGYSPYFRIGSTQQSAFADALTETGELWMNGILNTSTKGHGSIIQRLDAVHTIRDGYYQPYTTASCIYDAINGPSDDSAVSFPVPCGVPEVTYINTTEFNNSISHGPPSFVYPGTTKNQIFSIPGSLEQFRLKWIELPQDPFNGSAIGAIIQFPRSLTNSTQELIVCTLGAGWGSTIMNTSSDSIKDVSSVIDLSVVNTNREERSNTSYSETYLVPPGENEAGNSVNAFFLPYYPQQPIFVTEAWANYLNPFISALNTTVIDVLMSPHSPDALQQTQELIANAEEALYLLLANGLSNIGATGTLQGEIKTVVEPGAGGYKKIDGDYWFSGKGDMFTVDPEESKNWVKLRVDSTINGYAYNIRGVSSKVAISFLLAYCILALSHILYAAISGKRLSILVSDPVVNNLGISSTCWDSIGEVTALAMNSTPTTLLRNTCAGIMELNIYKLPVCVLAVRDSEEGDGEHLELVFGDVDERDIRGTPIEPNGVYGTLPKH